MNIRIFALAALFIAGAAFAVAEIHFERMGTFAPILIKRGLYVGPDTGAYKVQGEVKNKVTRILANSATVDFTSIRVGRQESSGITLTGAQSNDACEVGENSTAGALAATFSCYVSAADTVKIRFEPKSESAGACTLGGESPSVCPAQTVITGSVCTCSPVGTTAALAAAGCTVSVSGTTLTVTSLNGGTHVVNYHCSAPVDPASSTYYVRVTSSL